MNTKELRIGNYVFAKGKIVIVEDVITHGINLHHDCWEIESSDLSPIQLTENILLESGFKDYDGWFNKEGIELFNVNDRYFRGNYPINIDIKYVHQLQNLYYSLKGTELEIKL